MKCLLIFLLLTIPAHAATQYNQSVSMLRDSKYSSFHTTASHIIEKVYLSARNGDAESQYSIGILNIRGDRVERNIIEGCAWLIVSLKNGHTLAKEPTTIVYNGLSQNDKRLVKIRAQEISSTVLPSRTPAPVMLTHSRTTNDAPEVSASVDPLKRVRRDERQRRILANQRQIDAQLRANRINQQLDDINRSVSKLEDRMFYEF